MSDNWITVIPESLDFVPSKAALKETRAWFKRIAPKADEIEVTTSDEVRFFDCGANFERVTCPSCNAELEQDWWSERMGDDSTDSGFALQKFVLPCCRHQATLHELKYDWAQGFGRVAVSVMNPNIGALTTAQIAQLEQILGARVRVIYQHL